MLASHTLLQHLSGRFRLECRPCAFCRRCRRFKSWTAFLHGGLPVLCSLRFGLVNLIFGDLKQIFSQCALMLIAKECVLIIVECARYQLLSRDLNSDPGARRSGRLHCAPRVLHLGDQHDCRSLRCLRHRTLSAGDRDWRERIVCHRIYLQYLPVSISAPL